jgi:hypothetical protein
MGHRDFVTSFVMRRKSAVGQKPLQVSREKPTFPQEERFKTMQNIRALFLGLAGIAAITAIVVLTASITLAFAAMLAVFTAVKALSLRPKPVPVRAKASTGNKQDTMRVWNDGRGTIIDL